MFSECVKLKSLDLSGFNAHNVTNVYAMFCSCDGLKSLDLSGLDTTNADPSGICLDSCTASLSETEYTYDGTEKTPSVTVKNGSISLSLDENYTVSYENNVYAGRAYVVLTGIGAYTGKKYISFVINKAEPTIEFAEKEVSKLSVERSFANKLTRITDGKVSYTSDNTDVATVHQTSGRVTVQGEGSTVITVNAAAGNNYKAGSDSYVLTVKAVSIEKRR